MKATEVKIAELIAKIQKEIDMKKLDSLKSIMEKCQELASKNDFDSGSYHWLSSLAYGYYIISCETEEVVPKSGY